MEHRLSFRKGDLWAIALVALLALLTALAFLPGGGSEDGAQVQIWQDGRLLAQLPLDRDCSYPVQGDYRNTVCIEGGSVRISSSDCPGGDCLSSAAISTSGRSIVCLPNRVEVRIVGAHSEVDFVVGGAP